MRTINTSLRFLSALLFLLLIGCDKDNNEPDPVNEEELITSVYLEMVDTKSGDTALFSFVDLDGDGGQAPDTTVSILSDSTVYLVNVRFLDESKVPSEDITTEVIDEGDEHQVFYLVSNGLELTFDYSTNSRNIDADGNPIGVEATATTGAGGMGNLTVVLRHEPNKNAAGVSQGDITNAAGETDIEVEFIVDIQ